MSNVTSSVKRARSSFEIATNFGDNVRRFGEDAAPWDELRAQWDQAFGVLPTAAPPAIAVPDRPQSFELALARLPAPQTAISFGQPGLPTDDPAWEAQLVVNRILAGGGFASRLMEEVREKRGLSYGIGAQIVPFGARSTLVLGASSTENARVSETLSVLRAVWAEFAKEGPTAEELDDAKAYLAGSFPLSFTSTPEIARSRRPESARK